MRKLQTSLFLCLAFLVPSLAHASCDNLPSYDNFKAALKSARLQDNGGINTDMWGALIARDGTVCAIAFTGSELGSQWPGSRSIAVAKANTANNFSLKAWSFSTANLYSPTQPGGPLFGLATANPTDTESLMAGPQQDFGSSQDPLTGKMASGTIVFGGGLALYTKAGELVGALGVSGDTSCADHNIAWRVRNSLNLDFVPAGASPDKSDQIVYDVHMGHSSSGYGHPTCGGKEDQIAKKLPHIEKP